MPLRFFSFLESPHIQYRIFQDKIRTHRRRGVASDRGRMGAYTAGNPRMHLTIQPYHTYVRTHAGTYPATAKPFGRMQQHAFNPRVGWVPRRTYPLRRTYIPCDVCAVRQARQGSVIIIGMLRPLKNAACGAGSHFLTGNRSLCKQNIQ